MILSDLSTKEYLPYFQNFFNQLDEKKKLIDLLESNGEELTQFFKSVPAGKHEYAYQTGKWNLKEIINHLIDTERIFNYRALCIARKDKTPLNGFDENEYAMNSYATNRSFDSIIDEYITVRKATITLFKSFSNDTLQNVGQTGTSDVSVRALGFIIAGHETHHARVFKERYLE